MPKSTARPGEVAQGMGGSPHQTASEGQHCCSGFGTPCWVPGNREKGRGGDYEKMSHSDNFQSPYCAFRTFGCHGNSTKMGTVDIHLTDERTEAQ